MGAPRPALMDELRELDREAQASAAQPDIADLPETHITMDTLLGTSHYVEPSPHRLVKARRAQAGPPPSSSSSSSSSSSQPSLSLSKNHRQSAPKNGANNKRYPFTHKVTGRLSRRRPQSSSYYSRKKNSSIDPRAKPLDPRRAQYGHSNSALHIMAPNADTPSVAQDAGKSLWREWVDGQKLEAITYDSIALQLESRMARAAVLSRRHGRVNSLRTAVAFDCLDQLGEVFGRYGSVFRTIRAELEQSIYVDGHISSTHEAADMKRKTTELMDMASAAAERNKARHSLLHDDSKNSTTTYTHVNEGEEAHDDEEEDPEVLYGQRQTYFEQASMLEVERKRILDMASHLQGTRTWMLLLPLSLLETLLPLSLLTHRPSLFPIKIFTPAIILCTR